MSPVAPTPMDRWETLPWKQLQWHGVKRQNRLYRASYRDDHCHDRKTARDPRGSGASAKRHVTEEPCEGPTLMHGFGAEPGW
jgi:hypothetical protein